MENPDDVKVDTEKNTFDINSRQDTRGKNTSAVCEGRQKVRKPSGETFWDKENDFVEGRSEPSVEKIEKEDSHKASVKEKELAGNGTGGMRKKLTPDTELVSSQPEVGLYHLVEIDIDTFPAEKDCVTEKVESIGNEHDATESIQIENVISVQGDLPKP